MDRIKFSRFSCGKEMKCRLYFALINYLTFKYGVCPLFTMTVWQLIFGSDDDWLQRRSFSRYLSRKSSAGVPKFSNIVARGYRKVCGQDF